ncbi:DNA polymerase III subunit delta' [Ideonella margarita]|uniref:DNA polymerase III subunit delta n=1 Tax=Ideonella margarita TaxID=2984191 RepID=A0ABU9C937_9BURK
MSMRNEHDLPWLKDTLAALRDESRGHAIILHGGAGSGQFELALRAAQAWLCESAPGPCDRCTSCHLAVAHSHPDLKVVLPEALQQSLKWFSDGDGDADGGDGDSKSKRKPSREIRVEQVRQAIDWAHTSSGRGQGKVLVLFPADAMNTVSANALLKTLEEPAAGMRLLLCVDDPEKLLPTIRSRCQRVRLTAPSMETSLAWLKQQGHADAHILLAAAGGEPLAAAQLAAQGLNAAMWASLPAQMVQGDLRVWAAMAVPDALRAMQLICHDVMALTAGAEPRFFPADALEAGPDWQALIDWQRALVRTSRHADHPWQAPLLIEALAGQGRAALLGHTSSSKAKSPRIGTLRA